MKNLNAFILGLLVVLTGCETTDQNPTPNPLPNGTAPIEPTEITNQDILEALESKATVSDIANLRGDMMEVRNEAAEYIPRKITQLEQTLASNSRILAELSQKVDRFILYPSGEWAGVSDNLSLKLREWYFETTGKTPSSEFVRSMQNAYLTNGWVTLGTVVSWVLEHEPENYSPDFADVDPIDGPGDEDEPPTPNPGTKHYFGNFLFNWDLENWKVSPDGAPMQSTMTFLSPQKSDAERRAQLEDYVARGNTRIHIYFLNDDNYSGEDGSSLWVGVPWQPVFLRGAESPPGNFPRLPDPWYSRNAEEQLGDWLYWLVEMRKMGLRITGWMHPNDAADTFNDEGVWPDSKWENYNRYLLQNVVTYLWNGEEQLVDEIVIKLEADDEWSTRHPQHRHVRTSLELLNRRAAKLKSLADEAGFEGTIWYHNEADNSSTFGKVWDQFDWSTVDGIRIQKSLVGRINAGEVRAEAAIHVNEVPEGKLFYWCEYAGGDGYENHWYGDVLYELYKDDPRFMGLDNGGGPID